MGCITYINQHTDESVHSCQMCEELPNPEEKLIINGIEYIVVEIVHEITDGKKSIKVYLK